MNDLINKVDNLSINNTIEFDNLAFLQIIDGIHRKENIYIAGTGGSGKSYLMCKVFDFIQKTFHSVLTSTTGVSAFNIGGRTIHSWSGLILPDQIPKNINDFLSMMVNKIKNDHDLLNRWKNIELLFIDEISMLGGSYLDVLDHIAKKVRENDNPMGGIQIICSGDMLQLPPVKDEFPFECYTWKELEFKFYVLKTRYRFTDKNFANLLDRARVGKLTVNDINQLKTRVGKQSQGPIKPTIILSKKAEVDSINNAELNKLKGETIVIDATVTIKRNSLLHQDLGDLAVNEIPLDKVPKEIVFPVDLYIRIKIGAQVMLIKNLNVDTGLVNGARGVVMGYDESFIDIMFKNGVKTKIARAEFKNEETNNTYVCIQFPIILAWASTIHKSQGCTLDCARVDIGDSIFMAGQAYVALSRCKNLESLFIGTMNPQKIYADKIALRFESKMLSKCEYLKMDPSQDEEKEPGEA